MAILSLFDPTTDKQKKSSSASWEDPIQIFGRVCQAKFFCRLQKLIPRFSSSSSLLGGTSICRNYAQSSKNFTSLVIIKTSQRTKPKQVIFTLFKSSSIHFLVDPCSASLSRSLFLSELLCCISNQVELSRHVHIKSHFYSS